MLKPYLHSITCKDLLWLISTCILYVNVKDMWQKHNLVGCCSAVQLSLFQHAYIVCFCDVLFCCLNGRLFNFWNLITFVVAAAVPAALFVYCWSFCLIEFCPHFWLILVSLHWGTRPHNWESVVCTGCKRLPVERQCIPGFDIMARWHLSVNAFCCVA